MRYALGDIIFGVELLVVGMVILFAAMALLILIMVVLGHIFRTRREGSDTHELEITEAVGEDKEIVAIIAVALAKARSFDLPRGERSGLGAFLKTGRGLWWSMRNIQSEGRRPR